MTTTLPPPPPKTEPPQRARAMLGRAREELHHLRLWFRRTFTREHVVSNLKTLMWVAPLTVLIWVYAEREQTAREEDVPVQLDIRSEDPSRVVTGETDAVVYVNLRGPRSRLEMVKSKLSQPVPISIERTAALGAQELRLQLLVPNASLFRDNGVEVSNVRPSSVSIYVDQEIEREIDVTLRDEDQEFITSAVFTPRSVKVRGPEQVFQSAGGVKVYADLSAFLGTRGAERQAGQHEGRVPLELSVDNDLVKLSHTTVEAVVEVRQGDIEGEIKSVPVWWGGPPNITNEYAVEADEFIKNVKVVGPADEIARLESGTATPPPIAVLWIGREDLPSGTDRQKPLEWKMPPGVRVKDENQPYPFRLVPKDGVTR